MWLGKHTFDVPVNIRVRGIQTPVQATLMHVALAGCRLSSWVHLERGARVCVEWRLSDGRLLVVEGAVASRYSPRHGTAAPEYAVAFDKIAHEEADALAREAAMLTQKTAAARSFDTSLIDISQFTGYRVPDDFVVAYRSDDPRAVRKRGHACDVSSNGLRIRCEQPLRVDETIVLYFALPEHVLRVHKGKDDEWVLGPFGHRRMPRKYLRRPFQDLTITARVTARVKDSRRRDAYEVQFLNADGIVREELARYIHASQLANIKR
jgi:hypothetical protein